MTACVACSEAFLLSVIAAGPRGCSPGTAQWSSSWAIRLTAGMALLWPIGLCLLGLALWRSCIVPRSAALTLAISAVVFAVFAGSFVFLLGPLSTGQPHSC